MGIEDEFLEEYNGKQRTHLLSAFAGSCRRNEYGKTTKQVLTGGTVKSTICNIHSSFRTIMQSDPALDVDGESLLFFTQQLSGYIDEDPLSKKQKNLPISVFETLE